MSKPRVLIVEDDRDILAGLQNMLRRQRSVWDMHFCSSGAEALAELSRGPVELVISDLQMPGMDGVELLGRVRDASPQTARVILSSHSDQVAMMRAMQVAHQYLVKPCDAETLRSLIDRSVNLRGLLRDDATRALAARLDRLPSPPGAYRRLIEAIEKPEASLSEVAAIAAQDPAVSARLLQIVNSAYFGFSRRVVSIQQAVSYLGLHLIKGLALQAHLLVSLGAKEVPEALLERVQKSATLAGNLARTFAGDPSRAEAAFSAALVHGVGFIVLAGGLPPDAPLPAPLWNAIGLELAAEERKLFGVTHAEVGAYLLGVWGLPANLVEAVALHQEPRETPGGDVRLIAAVHVATALSAASITGRPLEEAHLDLEYLERAGLNTELTRWLSVAGSILPGLEAKMRS